MLKAGTTSLLGTGAFCVSFYVRVLRFVGVSEAFAASSLPAFCIGMQKSAREGVASRSGDLRLRDLQVKLPATLFLRLRLTRATELRFEK